jgi:hypothetical protein
VKVHPLATAVYEAATNWAVDVNKKAPTMLQSQDKFTHAVADLAKELEASEARAEEYFTLLCKHLQYVKVAAARFDEDVMKASTPPSIQQMLKD